MDRSWSVALLLLLALPALPGADASSPPPPSFPPPGSVWTVFTTVEADVRDNYAVVKVSADIRNRGPDPEFPFVVQVPDGAFVSGLTIVRDGVVHEARVAPRAEARAEYEAHKAIEQTGGLVEQRRGSQTYSFLVNVAEFTSVVATLTYETYVAADQGAHVLPLEAPVSGFGRDLGARFDVRIRHQDGVTGAWAVPAMPFTPVDGAQTLRHEVGPRPSDAATPLAVHYTVAPTPAAGSVLAARNATGGQFLHRFQAPPDQGRLPLDLVLVLDTSGSMDGEKMQQMQDAAAQVVQTLRAEDRLHLVFFSSTPTSPWEGLRTATPEVRSAAVAEVRALFAAGGTGIEAALKQGFAAFGMDAAPAAGRMPLLVFLTDGQPTVGATSPAVLRDTAKEANGAGARVFALAFGADADAALMQALAQDGGGSALAVPAGQGAEVDLRRFMAALTTPVLRDVEVDYRGDVDSFRATAPILFAGSEMLVAGTFGPEERRLRGDVTGTAADGNRTYPFDVPVPELPAPHLARLVAYARIRHLQDQIRAGAGGETQALVDEVVELALQHGFVTEHTSLVVTLEPRSTASAPGLPGAPAVQDNLARIRTGATGGGGTMTPMASATPAPLATSPPTWNWSSVPAGVATEADGDDAGDGRGVVASHAPADTAEDEVEERAPAPGWVAAAALALALLAARRRLSR